MLGCSKHKREFSKYFHIQSGCANIKPKVKSEIEFVNQFFDYGAIYKIFIFKNSSIPSSDIVDAECGCSHRLSY